MSKIIGLNDNPVQRLSARLAAQELASEALAQRTLEVIRGMNTITRVLDEMLKSEGGLQGFIQKLQAADVAAAQPAEPEVTLVPPPSEPPVA